MEKVSPLIKKATVTASLIVRPGTLSTQDAIPPLIPVLKPTISGVTQMATERDANRRLKTPRTQEEVCLSSWFRVCGEV